MASSRTDARIDALYALPLGEFVVGRKRLADDLKKAGDNPGARAVAALAKPSLAAWITNQTVRGAAPLVKKLLAITDTLAAAQRAIGRPGSQQEEFQEALAEQRQAVTELNDLARTLLAATGQKVGGAVLDKVEKNLRWGAISSEARPLFERGRLIGDVPPPGFDGLVDGGDTAASPVVRAHPAAPPRGDGQRRRAAAQARDTRSELAELRLARAETTAARAALARLEKARAKAEARTKDAEKTLAASHVALASADKDVSHAQAALQSRQSKQGELERRLEEMEGQ